MTKNRWELLVLNAASGSATLSSLALAVNELDGDEHQEIAMGGEGGLLWYRPDAFEEGVIAEGQFHVSFALEGLDGDGRFEHHCGTKLIDLGGGKLGVMSHGWNDSIYRTCGQLR